MKLMKIKPEQKEEKRVREKIIDSVFTNTKKLRKRKIKEKKRKQREKENEEGRK
ncbi:MAG: hypothetical protein Q8P67_19505 [archaeon]|nr:hypothetical protein [archaeon]